VEYIVKKSGGRLRPTSGTPERLRGTYWVHYAEGSLMPPLVMRLIFSLLPVRSPALIRVFARAIAAQSLEGWVDQQLKTHFDFIESDLGCFPWFAGADFSAADVMMSFPLEAGGDPANAFAGRPRIKAFTEAIHARPAYRRALERGGPYRYAS
jgi:glutathione S-transferase